MNSNMPDPEDVGKLFVGGLSADTTKESLHDYFSQFGDVIDSVVMKNNETGRSRGFGFVTFKDPNCIFKALQIKNHELDGKKIDPKECTPRSMQKTRKQAGKCKIFLGGLPPDITEESIRSALSKFGKVDQVVIMFDQETKKCRGFGFLSFELEESIDQACAERFVIINGKQIECKKAEPRINPKRLTQTYDMSKNQNGFAGQSSYGQIASVQHNNWSSPANQALYTLPGTPFSSYPSYNTGMVTLNTGATGYAAVQSLPFVQSFPANFGTPIASYSYSTVPSNTYTQPNFTNSQTPSAVHSPPLTSEAGKSYGSNDYSQSPSSYGPSKAYIGGNATDVTYSNQGALAASNYQRYHPYKV